MTNPINKKIRICKECGNPFQTGDHQTSGGRSRIGGRYCTSKCGYAAGARLRKKRRKGLGMIKDNRAQFTLRMPLLLHRRIKRSARENNRTLNAEIVELLERSRMVQRNDYLLEAAASHIKSLQKELRKRT